MPLQRQRLQANVALLKGSATEAKDIKDNNIMAGIIMVDSFGVWFGFLVERKARRNVQEIKREGVRIMVRKKMNRYASASRH